MSSQPLASFIAGQVNGVSNDPWAAQPTLRRAFMARPDDVFGYDDIDRILNQAGSSPLPFYLVREQHMPEQAKYPTRADVDRFYDDGFTVVMPALQRHTPNVAALCEAIMAQTGIPSFGGAYVTPPNSQGFDLHWDLGSVTVLQTVGSKDWVLSKPVVTTDAELNIPWSVRGFSQEERGRPPYVNITLHKGDVLFIPRGWVHAARATSEQSVHVSIEALHKGIDLDTCSTVYP